jgi:transposase
MVWDSQIRWRAIVLHYVYGIDARRVSMILGPSERSILNWQILFEETGSVDAMQRHERKSRWPQYVLDFVLDYAEQNPTFLIEELQEEIRANFPSVKNISNSTICRALRHDLNLTRKKIVKRAIERSKVEIMSYKSRLSPFYFYQEQLVFVDETSKDSRDFRRKHGWSERGQDCVSEEPSSRGNRRSILAALDVHGFFAYEATEGTFDRRAFHNAMVTKIFPRMNPWPLPRSILIMDNARIHAYEELFKTAESFGVCLVFLPPYCPDLNPIEYGFGDFKRWIQHFPGGSS